MLSDLVDECIKSMDGVIFLIVERNIAIVWLLSVLQRENNKFQTALSPLPV